MDMRIVSHSVCSEDQLWENKAPTKHMAEHFLLWQSVLDLDWSLKLDKERSLGVWAKKASPSSMVASDSTSLEAGLWVTKELQG